jgi:protein-disulfide isomerase
VTVSRRIALVRAAYLVVGIGALLQPPTGATAQESSRIVPSEQEVVLQRADRARTKGDTMAPIRIVEISDFECPYCGRYHAESWPVIDSLYVRTGIARYLWISFPNSTHPRAWPAVEAAFCAGAAGRFWEMHGILFDRTDEWKRAADPAGLFTRWAVELGVDEASYAACLRNDLTAPLQVADYDSAVRSGITSTPFFIVGDSIAIRGAVSTDRFRTAIDSVLSLRGLESP